jgi:hypothetical protein
MHIAPVVVPKHNDEVTLPPPDFLGSMNDRWLEPTGVINPKDGTMETRENIGLRPDHPLLAAQAARQQDEADLAEFRAMKLQKQQEAQRLAAEQAAAAEAIAAEEVATAERRRNDTARATQAAAAHRGGGV